MGEAFWPNQIVRPKVYASPLFWRQIQRNTNSEAQQPPPLGWRSKQLAEESERICDVFRKASPLQVIKNQGKGIRWIGK